MSAWIPTTFAITLMAAATAVNAGSCSRENLRSCFNAPATVNFTAVPSISEQIVSQEHPDRQQQKLTIDPPAPAAPYTGPMFGTSLGRRAPTVGYQWSLE